MIRHGRSLLILVRSGLFLIIGLVIILNYIQMLIRSLGAIGTLLLRFIDTTSSGIWSDADAHYNLSKMFLFIFLGYLGTILKILNLI